MKKNNKGFMLAEVVVTSTLLLTIMVSLFFTFNKIYVRYNNLAAYKNIDGMFALDNIMEHILNEEGEDNINNVFKKIEGQEYAFIIKDGECQNIINSDYCENIMNGYTVNNLIIVKQQKASIDSFNNNNTLNNTFKEYLDYIKKYYAYTDYTKDSYLLLIEYNKEKDIYYYSSLELR